MPELLKVERVYEGWGRYCVATFRDPRGREFRREIEDHGHAAVVLPYDGERRCAILVGQFRAPMFVLDGCRSVLEAVAGGLEPDEDPRVCAKREALEEAGLQLQELEPVAVIATMPGISTERLHLFLAPYRAEDRVGDGGGLETEHEDITVHEIALKDLANMADRGEIIDLKTLVLVQTLRIRRPELMT